MTSSTEIPVSEAIPGTPSRRRLDPLSVLLILFVKCYQWTLGPFFRGRCRFHPTCSVYFIEAVKMHGPFVGTWKGILRLLRCHPFHPGGYDPP